MLQSRINAFESLAAANKASIPLPRPMPAKCAPNSQDFIGTPLSPKSASSAVLASHTQSPILFRPPSPSPTSPDRRQSLIDLKDWVVADSPPRQNSYVDHRLNGVPAENTLKTAQRHYEQRHTLGNQNSQIIPLASPKSSTAPPLPPRKPSYTSLKSVSSVASLSTRSGGSSPPSHTALSPNAVSIEHTYPPSSRSHVFDINRGGKGHVPTTSITSLHSVSLSSDGGTPDSSVTTSRETISRGSRRDDDFLGLDESFEDVSASSIISPTSASLLANRWESAAKGRLLPLPPPAHLKRPASHMPSPLQSHPPVPSLPARSSSTSVVTTRRPPPPPPPPLPTQSKSSRATPPRSSRPSFSASDRTSIVSSGSRASSVAETNGKKVLLSRATPVPAAARKRYEAVFNANVLQRREAEKLKEKDKLRLSLPKKSRQAAGWRGLSVDLITNPLNSAPPMAVERTKTEELEIDAGVGPEERLGNTVVRVVWSASRLDKSKLKAIWDTCDPKGCGALDRDSFVKGMWRIDEELRKVRTTPQAASLPPSQTRRHPPPKQSVVLR